LLRIRRLNDQPISLTNRATLGERKGDSEVAFEVVDESVNALDVADRVSIFNRW
jgi:hypothetical protein